MFSLCHLFTSIFSSPGQVNSSFQRTRRPQAPEWLLSKAVLRTFLWPKSCVRGVFSPWQQPLIFCSSCWQLCHLMTLKGFSPFICAGFLLFSESHLSLSLSFPVFFLALSLVCALWNSWWAVLCRGWEDVSNRCLENHSRNVPDVLQIHGAGGCWEGRVYPAPWGVQMGEANGSCW